MTGDRKLAANHLNAARSTGPRTAAGLARSSSNAVRHGLHTAAVVPALGECPEDFEQLRLAVRAQLRPRGVVDGRLADRVALLLWRLDRVTRHEVAVTQTAASSPELPPDPDSITGDGIDRVVRAEAHLTRQLEATLGMFDRVRGLGRKRKGVGGIGVVLRGLAARVVEAGGPVPLPAVGLGSFGNGGSAEDVPRVARGAGDAGR